VIQAVVAACGGNTPAAARLELFLADLAQQADWRSLVAVLRRILFLALVAQACRPDAPAGLGEQLYAVTRGMMTDPNAPGEFRALGRALNAILSGARAVDLSALPPEPADKIRGLLESLR